MSYNNQASSVLNSIPTGVARNMRSYTLGKFDSQHSGQAHYVWTDIMMSPSATKLSCKHHTVNGSYDCSQISSLTSLEGSPAVVIGSFVCSDTKITSLKGGPKEVGGDYRCQFTQIESLEHVASYIGGFLHCQFTQIKSLHDIHKMIKHVNGIILLPCTIESSILGLFKVGGLKSISIERKINEGIIMVVEDIINKYLPTKDIHLAQEELLEAGLKEFARL